MSSSPSSSSDDEDAPRLDTLDISNDEYYKPSKDLLQRQQQQKHLSKHDLDIPQYGSPTIQHSLPAYDLWRPFFPTWLSEEKFHTFHRSRLRHYNTGPQSKFRFKLRQKPYPVKSLSRCIHRFQKKLRNKVISAINQGQSREEIVQNFLLIREAKDLTAKQGELFLFEYSEEFPPVLSQIGMASNLKTLIPTENLSKPVIVTESGCNQNKPNPLNKPNGINSNNNNPNPNNSNGTKQNASNGPQSLAQQSEVLVQDITGYIEKIPCQQTAKQPYFNKMRPGVRTQVIENNLYRAPIFRHKMSSCDFLMVRTRQGIYIRNVSTIYTVGQTMPLMPIPPPTDSAITKFRADLSNYYIHKMFLESDKDSPNRIMNFDDLLRLFPDYHRNNLTKRLYTRGARRGPPGVPTIYLQGTSNFGHVPLKMLRSSLTPENYCLNMSMLAARQRLRELNYTESMIMPAKTNKTDMETEVLAAPWNTSGAIADAHKGRVYLNFKDHLIDPTGPQKEGFSCVPWVKSETEELQRQQQLSGNGTNGFASQMTSTPMKLPPNKNPLSGKINREKISRLATYIAEANRIALVQAQVLSSAEVLSSEEEDDEMEEEEADVLNASFDQQLEDLDKMVVGGRTTGEIDYEREEEERRQLLNDLNIYTPTGNEPPEKSPTKGDTRFNLKRFENKILKITRKYNSPEGVIERTEVVREPKIIALYVKQKTGNDTGSAPSSQELLTNGKTSHINGRVGGDQNTAPPQIPRRNSLPANGHNHNSSSTQRKNQTILGPSELCRTEGVKITISKKVLDPRVMRKTQRDSNRDSE